MKFDVFMGAGYRSIAEKRVSMLARVGCRGCTEVGITPMSPANSVSLHAAAALLLCAQDKSKPNEYQKPEGLTQIPRESELGQMPLDKFKAFFSPESLGTLFGASS